MNKNIKVKKDLQRGYVKVPNKNLTFLKILKVLLFICQEASDTDLTFAES